MSSLSPYSLIHHNSPRVLSSLTAVEKTTHDEHPHLVKTRALTLLCVQVRSGLTLHVVLTITNVLPEQSQTLPTIRQPEESKPAVEQKDTAAPTTNAPLAPPPRPTQNGQEGDYFVAAHSTTHLAKEPNPFENAFGNPIETPGKTQLPGVTSLTSPASLLPGNTPGWPGSLRSGPLSPAMLTGPTGGNDYFSNDHHFPASFPTPNESSLRTGLTPGGGGSMFPQPSPNSQAIFNAIQSGGATPGTLDFHRTAMHARAASNANSFVMPQPTSQPQDPNIQPNLDSKGFGQQQANDPFEQHDANDAANGLFLLANARNNRSQPQAYPPPQQQPQMNYMGNNAHMSNQMAQQSHENSPNLGNRNSKNSVVSNMSGSTQNEQGDFSESGHSEETKPQARNRGKKGSATKVPTNGRRRTEDTPAKPNKRQKGNNGASNSPEEDMDSDDDQENKLGADGKKMTDEEKRKNFLERNR